MALKLGIGGCKGCKTGAGFSLEFESMASPVNGCDVCEATRAVLERSMSEGALRRGVDFASVRQRLRGLDVL